METYDNRRDAGKDDRSLWAPGGMWPLLPGLILVGIGALFLLDNLHIVRMGSYVGYWPVILIAIGLAKLVDSTHTGGRIAGGVMIGLGGLFLADNLGYLSFQVEDLWPLILIAIGLMLLWHRTLGGAGGPGWGSSDRFREKWERRRFSGAMPFSANTVHEYAVFGGSRRVVTDQDFKGGRVASVFGGVHLDLSGANMTGNTAVLDISSVYGGAVIRIPTTWNLEVRGAGIFGGFVDRTVHPPASPEMKRLIVRGAAVFGGVTFRN